MCREAAARGPGPAPPQAPGVCRPPCTARPPPAGHTLHAPFSLCHCPLAVLSGPVWGDGPSSCSWATSLPLCPVVIDEAAPVLSGAGSRCAPSADLDSLPALLLGVCHQSGSWAPQQGPGLVAAHFHTLSAGTAAPATAQKAARTPILPRPICAARSCPSSLHSVSPPAGSGATAHPVGLTFLPGW